MKRTTALLLSVGLASTILVSGLVVVATDVMATSTSQSICVNKETKVLKLRKNCRATERYMGSADVLKNGGESAYETWLGLGNRGSEQDFINSLRGSSGSSRSDSVFADMPCSAISAFYSQNYGKHYRYKSVWNEIEREHSCRLDTSQGVYYRDTDFNGVLMDFDLTALDTPILDKTIYANHGPTYDVPVLMDIAIQPKNGWVVCNPDLPIYENSEFASGIDFAHWEQIESFKTGFNQYSIPATVRLRPDGLFVTYEDADEDPSILQRDRLPMCRENAEATLGWEYYADGWIFVPPLKPSEFTGMNIHYISEWGWE